MKKPPLIIQWAKRITHFGDWVKAPIAVVPEGYTPIPAPRFKDYTLFEWIEASHQHMLATHDFSWPTASKILVPAILAPLLFQWFLSTPVDARAFNVDAVFNSSVLDTQRISDGFDVIWDNDVPLYINAAKTLFVSVGVVFIARLITDMYNESIKFQFIAWRRLVAPIAVLAFVVPGSPLLHQTLLGTRNGINDLGQQALLATALQSQTDQAMAINSYKMILSPAIRECGGIEPGPEQTACFQQAVSIGNQMLDRDRAEFGNRPWVNRFQGTVNALGSIGGQIRGTTTTTTGTIQAEVNRTFAGIPVPDVDIDIEAYLAGVGDALMSAFEELIMTWMASCALGFQMSMEVSLIVTTLAAPLALYLSFGDAGALPAYGFAVGVWGVALTNIWFKMLAGISSASLVTSEGATQLAWAITVGLFAPLFAFSLSAGGGAIVWGVILQKLSFSAAQGAGRNKGVTAAA